MARHSLLPDGSRSPYYGVLLVVLVLLIVVSPLATGRESEFVVEFFLDLVLVVGVYSAVASARVRWPFVALTVLTFAWRWSGLLAEGDTVQVGALGITVIWMAVAIAFVVKAFFEQTTVDTNMIFGAVVVYLLAGVAFGLGYELLELLQPDSFSGVTDGGHPRQLGNELVYFSFISLTTMGYGDVLPVSNLARSLSVMEGAFGTLYLAVMIARLVGLHSQSKSAS